MSRHGSGEDQPSRLSALEAEVFLDMLREGVIDLRMPWNRPLLPGGGVAVDIMTGRHGVPVCSRPHAAHE
jgi:hypothetical protein